MPSNSARARRAQLSAACVCIAAAVLCGCTGTRHREASELAEIDVAAGASCNEPSAFVRELRDARSKKIKTRTAPIRVPAGVYSIGVSCGAALNGETAACAEESASRERSDVPAYELVLMAGRRYLFSCARVRDQDTIRLSESAL